MESIDHRLSNLLGKPKRFSDWMVGMAMAPLQLMTRADTAIMSGNTLTLCREQTWMMCMNEQFQFMTFYICVIRLSFLVASKMDFASFQENITLFWKVTRALLLQRG